MTAKESALAGTSAEDASNGLDSLAEGLLAYLHEVQADAEMCRRHEATTAILATGRYVTTTCTFSASDMLEKRVVKAAGSLPAWDESPWAKTQLPRWEKLRNTICGREAMQPVIIRGVTWEGHPVLIIAPSSGPGDSLELSLLSPFVPTDLPELPSLTLARALRCSEYLVPDIIARPLSLAADDEKAATSIRTYLERTMPKNLYASQCFFTACAGE